jgi:tetratricopeptide (TPR) repeat protein
MEAFDLDVEFPQATSGDIAAINLTSAREQSWSQFWRAPLRPGVAEYIVEQEQMAAQFLGDMKALDRLATLVTQLARVDPESMRTALVNAQVASLTHRFVEARRYLAQAEIRGAPRADINRLSLSLNQACDTRIGFVLAARRKIAGETGRLEDLLPLGALLADLREFDEADRIYHQALSGYGDVSPFALAWVCFQLGVLWGELATEPQLAKATGWYRKAIGYLPSYVKARVHLSEIYLRCGRADEAEALLVPSLESGDPEVFWRLAEAMAATGRPADAETLMQAARSEFEILLREHLLAFADHGAEFNSGSGGDPGMAFELAKVNLANRPRMRAFEQAYAAAVGAGETDAASEILAAAEKRCGETSAFGLSPLAAHRAD